ncbi:hypothetical protein A4R26_18480 [Niastella populi]|uniref:Protein FecR C-terminal domain-containing protein n=1 Tax=Niastella populi TaxID=550983 RepID=A0A1V9FV63_9BACT|nr:hypothetical protein A4R26_18480 [Niastella populi]
MFVFRDLDIKNVMHQIARWYNINIVYEDLVLDRFTATVPRTISLENLLNVLELSSKNIRRNCYNHRNQQKRCNKFKWVLYFIRHSNKFHSTN